MKLTELRQLIKSLEYALSVTKDINEANSIMYELQNRREQLRPMEENERNIHSQGNL